MINFICIHTAAFGRILFHLLNLSFLWEYFAGARKATADTIRVNEFLCDDFISRIWRNFLDTDLLEETRGLKFVEIFIVTNSWSVLRAVLGQSVQYAMLLEEAYLALADHWTQKPLSYIIFFFEKSLFFVICIIEFLSAIDLRNVAEILSFFYYFFFFLDL